MTNAPFDEFNLSISMRYEEDGEPCEGQFQIDVYDDDGMWYAQTVGPDFRAALQHALYLANPVLACAAFEDYFEWANSHLTAP